MYSIFLQYKLYSVQRRSAQQGEEGEVGRGAGEGRHWWQFFTALETQFKSELAAEWSIHKWES